MINRNYNQITFGLIIFIFFMYLYENFIVYFQSGYHFFHYYLKSALWILVVVYLLKIAPRVRSHTKERYKNYFKLWALICGIIYIFGYMLTGIINEFGTNPNSFDMYETILKMVTEIFKIIGRESIRFFILNRTYKKYKKFFSLNILFIMLFSEISLIQILKLSDFQTVFIFVIQILAPLFAKNIFLNYISAYSNILSSVIYASFLSLFLLVLPIIPEVQWLFTGLVGTLLPLFSYVIVSTAYETMISGYKVYRKKSREVFSWVLVSLMSISLIWFSVGVFDIFPSVIVTGSMEPLIRPGDMALLHKITEADQIKRLKIGDVIQFEREDGMIVLHRVIEIVVSDGVIAYRTKGDNNNTADQELVRGQNIRGTLYKVIPKIGIPTLIFRSDNEVDLSDLVF